MNNIFKETSRNIKEIRDLVEVGKFQDEEKFPLDSFKNQPEVICDLIRELDECAKNY